MRKRLLPVVMAALLAVTPAGCSFRQTPAVSGNSFPERPALSDGHYLADVRLEGGSGRASVASPCEITVSGGAVTARIVFSSPNYDYVKMDGKTYLPVSAEGNAAFEIPLSSLDEPQEITADTTAMSVPHEIDYTLIFDPASLRPGGKENAGTGSAGAGETEITGTGAGAAETEITGTDAGAGETDGSLPGAEGEAVPLSYAHEFSAAANQDGSYDISIGEDRFHIDRPYRKIYLAASSAMDLFLAAGAASSVAMTGTKAADWGIEEVREMVEDGTIAYAGKYSAPDYEYLLSSGCDLAVESTMIYHSPEVKEKLESLGIPVLVERSSYETDPLGRMEWIKLYGILTGHYEEAAAFFEKKAGETEAVLKNEPTGKKVVYFYINSAGQPVVRKPGDYITRMIGMAGGTYFLGAGEGGDSPLSTMNMQMEAFAEAAADADILIYSSAIEGEIRTMGELTEKEPLLQDFRAVREGSVWCTGKNMFQETASIADMILEMREIFSGAAGDGSSLRFFHRL